MGQITITATRNTPSVKFSEKDGVLNISGKSYPEDASVFYTSLTNELLALHKPTRIHLVLDFEYLNSSSVACILQMLKDIKTKQAETVLSIEMHYEFGDDDMVSVGENMQQLSKIPVTFIQKK